MAQDPMKVDQLQVEPGAAGTRLINRATDGSLQFYDAFITGGITLSRLAGLRNVLGVGFQGVRRSGDDIADVLNQAARFENCRQAENEEQGKARRNQIHQPGSGGLPGRANQSCQIRAPCPWIGLQNIKQLKLSIYRFADNGLRSRCKCA